MKGGIAVIDFGSQVTQLIARRLRELRVYTEIFPYTVDLDELYAMKPDGVVLSGGPSSVYEDGAPQRALTEFIELAPVLGICYGMQLIAQELGGQVKPSSSREYGFSMIRWSSPIAGVPEIQKVWMSHGDIVEAPPPGFQVVATSETGHPAAMTSDRIMCLQFHPEVEHTDSGRTLLAYFIDHYCQAQRQWDPPHITDHLLSEVKSQVKDGEHVLCALSGGVDSSVVATLLTQALGADRVHCVFVNNGLLRLNEYESVLETYKNIGLNVRGVDASDGFLSQLQGVEDPEQKRKIIGRVFIEVFEQAASDLGRVDWLAQGTLYPDVIESVSPRGGSVTIKSHHNVGGLPERMKLNLIEPLRELFKDEVREIGQQLELPNEVLGRHPFPGPGLAIRIIGPVTAEAMEILRQCDSIYVDELRRNGLYDQIWQAFCVLLPVKTVGVQGDGRTYESVLALRAVTSTDGMTADWFSFSPDVLRRLSNRITNEVQGVNRVVYDVTSKPPGTIEWE